MFPDFAALEKAGADAVKNSAANHQAAMTAMAAQLKALLEIRDLLKQQLQVLKGEEN